MSTNISATYNVQVMSPVLYHIIREYVTGFGEMFQIAHQVKSQ